MVAENFNYLLPEVKDLLQLSFVDRIKYIQKDCWIGYPRAKQALRKLYQLYTHPQRQRMPNLLIVGPTNNGKTMLIEKFCRDYPPRKEKQKTYIDSHYGYDEVEYLAEMPIVSVQMPPNPDVKRFYLSILDQIGMMGGRGLMHTAPLEISILETLRRLKVRMLIIDEIHNILAGRNDRQLEFLNILRFLGNSLRIPLVCVGTKDAYLAIRSDPQLENRFEPFPMPIWKIGDEYESLLASIVAVVPLEKPSDLNDPVISEYILTKSEGVIGEMMMLIKRAAISAIYTGVEKIDEKAIKFADYHSPSERRQVFERSIIEDT